MTRWFIRLLLLPALAGAPASAADDDLYRGLGERTGLARVVDAAAARWLADPRIRDTFAETNMTRLRARLTDQLCELSGGPCAYAGHDMRAAHQGLHIGQAQFNALVEDLQDAMDGQAIPFRVQNRLLALLAPMRDDVTGAGR